MKREKKLPHRGPAAMQALEPNMTMSSADRQCTLCISPRICGVGGGGKNEYVPCYFETNDYVLGGQAMHVMYLANDLQILRKKKKNDCVPGYFQQYAI